MTVDVVKNMGASVWQRLLNHANAGRQAIYRVLQYYAMAFSLSSFGVASRRDLYAALRKHLAASLRSSMSKWCLRKFFQSREAPRRRASSAALHIVSVI